MIRRFLLTFALVVAGFTAGMVLTGRMRFANDTAAETAPLAAAPEEQRGAGGQAAAPQASAPISVGPDFTKIAGQAVKGVANISSLQVVRRQNTPFENDPFFQYFFALLQEIFNSIQFVVHFNSDGLKDL